MAAIVVGGCTSPTQRIEQRASANQFQRLELPGRDFLHVAFSADASGHSDVLRVYVEHDGSPWVDGGTRPAVDPTPRVPLALELMALDVGPRLYLGRPCYMQRSMDERCHELVWTHQRFMPEIVDSMVAALRGFLSKYRFSRVVLVGHSGGGTLAWLMARQMSEVTQVYTLAANLDIDYWARIHKFSPLTGSSNPALLPDLPPEIVQVHFVGSLDDQVPVPVAKSFGRTHPNARIVVIPGFDHSCCWARRWPNLVTVDVEDPASVRREAEMRGDGVQ